MTNRRQARDDGQRGFRLHLQTLGYVNGESPDARRTWLAGFWALVLGRFREHAEDHRHAQDSGHAQDADPPATRPELGDEEDR